MLYLMLQLFAIKASRRYPIVINAFTQFFLGSKQTICRDIENSTRTYYVPTYAGQKSFDQGLSVRESGICQRTMRANFFLFTTSIHSARSCPPENSKQLCAHVAVVCE